MKCFFSRVCRACCEPDIFANFTDSGGSRACDMKICRAQKKLRESKRAQKREHQRESMGFTEGRLEYDLQKQTPSGGDLGGHFLVAHRIPRFFVFFAISIFDLHSLFDFFSEVARPPQNIFCYFEVGGRGSGL